MGYCYDYAGRLVCDGCGNTSATGTRVIRRKCSHKVLGDTLRGKTRVSMHYCYPPALCSSCYQKEGGKHIHDKCAEGARRSQAEYDAIEAALDAGEMFVISAYGSWHAEVPEGKVGVLFSGRSGELQRLVDQSAYDQRGKNPKLSDFESAPWNM